MSTAPTSVADDQYFMESFKRGDQAAFKMLVDSVCGDLYTYVEGVVKERATADSIVSECFYRLFHQREGLTSYGDIRKWLFVTAGILCMDHGQK